MTIWALLGGPPIVVRTIHIWLGLSVGALALLLGGVAWNFRPVGLFSFPLAIAALAAGIAQAPGAPWLAAAAAAMAIAGLGALRLLPLMGLLVAAVSLAWHPLFGPGNYVSGTDMVVLGDYARSIAEHGKITSGLENYADFPGHPLLVGQAMLLTGLDWPIPYYAIALITFLSAAFALISISWVLGWPHGVVMGAVVLVSPPVMWGLAYGSAQIVAAFYFSVMLAVFARRKYAALAIVAGAGWIVLHASTPIQVAVILLPVVLLSLAAPPFSMPKSVIAKRALAAALAVVGVGLIYLLGATTSFNSSIKEALLLSAGASGGLLAPPVLHVIVVDPLHVLRTKMGLAVAWALLVVVLGFVKTDQQPWPVTAALVGVPLVAMASEPLLALASQASLQNLRLDRLALVAAPIAVLVTASLIQSSRQFLAALVVVGVLAGTASALDPRLSSDYIWPTPVPPPSLSDSEIVGVAWVGAFANQYVAVDWQTLRLLQYSARSEWGFPWYPGHPFTGRALEVERPTVASRHGLYLLDAEGALLPSRAFQATNHELRVFDAGDLRVWGGKIGT